MDGLAANGLAAGGRLLTDRFGSVRNVQRSILDDGLSTDGRLLTDRFGSVRNVQRFVLDDGLAADGRLLTDRFVSARTVGRTMLTQHRATGCRQKRALRNRYAISKRMRDKF